MQTDLKASRNSKKIMWKRLEGVPKYPGGSQISCHQVRDKWEWFRNILGFLGTGSIYPGSEIFYDTGPLPGDEPPRAPRPPRATSSHVPDAVKNRIRSTPSSKAATVYSEIERPSTLPPPRWPSGKASASRAEGPGFESRLRRDFVGVESYL